ncbi:MAG: tunicamycin resistance protein, partial [Proteobacteria bacterium]
MIIMINGSFGVGKTSVATLLYKQIPNAIFFDPEEIGAYARLVTKGVRAGEEDTDDFQDIELWRTLTVTTGQALYRRYQRSLIVPMTLSNRAYLETIRSGFEEVAPVAHFCLTAPLSVVQQRIIGRGNEPGSWVWRKAEHCVPLLFDPYYG